MKPFGRNVASSLFIALVCMAVFAGCSPSAGDSAADPRSTSRVDFGTYENFNVSDFLAMKNSATASPKATPSPNGQQPAPSQSAPNVTVPVQNLIIISLMATTRDKSILDVGDACYLSLKMEPTNANNFKIAWTSSDPGTARISEANNAMCCVRGVYPGYVTITATSDNGVTSTFEMTIRPKVPTPTLINTTFVPPTQNPIRK
jgi:hypothetical protein